MGEIKFSVIVTVLNEEENTESLLRSLINQSVVPEEIIIIDAGSTDKTLDLIKEIAATSPILIKILSRPGLNRSKARNEGIKQAKSKYIAVTDAGCEAKNDWLSNLEKRFETDTEAVAGFYLPKIEKPIQNFFSRYTCTSPNEFNAVTFLPSSRSVAFTKEIWEKVQGYPEHLDTCEDLVYAKKLFDTGKMRTEKKALVYWNQAKDYGEFFKQISGYAKGDMEALYWPHVLKIITVWLRYILFLYYPWLLIFYWIFIIKKNIKLIKSVNDIFSASLVQLTTDLAMIIGTLRAQRLWVTHRQ